MEKTGLKRNSDDYQGHFTFYIIVGTHLISNQNDVYFVSVEVI